ncbi:hypothetical protein JF66_16240 [Cryobacterium sp. MLB-32]|uniref:acetyltransferase n=1 Tax=Cryobacterium sp. MLB-32 TaxID=1529318 RepID=UPI0004E6F2B8|nr:acetyltransferase [Cryobacterium sp. MLB-32]KFF58751.1 hypothetical protein JF66_16240 [Cryobacterium sp. MLB-32]
MSTELIVVGAGGFGRQTLDVVEALNHAAGSPVFDLLGVVDTNPSDLNRERLEHRGVPHLGTVAEWLAYDYHALYLIGIGDPVARQRVDRLFVAAGMVAATAVHPSAWIGSQAAIGDGTVVCGGVQVSTNVHLGRHVHLNPHAAVGHDAVLHDFVSVNPAAIVSGEVEVGERSMIGAGAVILQGLSVGSGAVVGASACVVRNVAGDTVVKGVPAR